MALAKKFKAHWSNGEDSYNDSVLYGSEAEAEAELSAAEAAHSGPDEDFVGGITVCYVKE